MAESLMDKERHRWSYMTENQLTTRLRRITNPEKLRCFIQLAIDKDNRLLEHLATERLYMLEEEKGGSIPIVPVFSEPMPMVGDMNRWISKKTLEKEKAKKKAEDNIRKILI